MAAADMAAPYDPNVYHPAAACRARIKDTSRARREGATNINKAVAAILSQNGKSERFDSICLEWRLPSRQLTPSPFVRSRLGAK
jgi:hypothetical protein